MNKIVYIIPGFTEKVNLKGYQQIIKFFKSKNFKVIPIKISWQYKVMSNYVDEFFSQLSHQQNDEVYLFGFSFGAIIAFISAVRIKPKILLLCSLSPYFNEDLKSLKKSWKNRIGKKRMEDLKKFSFNKLVKNINCKTILVAGKNEGKELDTRVNDAHNKIKKSELIIIDGAKHEISQKEYIDKLHKIISNL